MALSSGCGLSGIALLLAAASGCVSSGEEVGGEAVGAQTAVLPAALASIEGDPTTGSAIARIGPTRFALIGARVIELRAGQRYKLSLAATGAAKKDGLEVRRLVELSRVIRLVGTLSDDATDASMMQLRSVHAKTYALYGDSATAYKEIRATLPSHDYAKTLFTVNVVQDLGGNTGATGSTRWEWLDYAPLPLYTCTQADQPGTHLDLVDVRPDASLLDGFVTTPIGGREARVGAHATCSSEGPAYVCELDSVGTPWGSARFVPADGHFEVVVDRRDDAKTRVMFSCATTKRDDSAVASED